MQQSLRMLCWNVVLRRWALKIAGPNSKWKWLLLLLEIKSSKQDGSWTVKLANLEGTTCLPRLLPGGAVAEVKLQQRKLQSETWMRWDWQWFATFFFCGYEHPIRYEHKKKRIVSCICCIDNEQCGKSINLSHETSRGLNQIDELLLSNKPHQNYKNQTNYMNEDTETETNHRTEHTLLIIRHRTPDWSVLGSCNWVWNQIQSQSYRTS